MEEALAPRPFDVVLFDLDGTLAESLPLLKTIYRDLVLAYGGRPSDEEFDLLNGKSLSEICWHLRGVHGIPKATDELIAEYRALIDARYVDEAVPGPGAATLLEDLLTAGFRLGLVTSAPESIAHAFLVRHHLRAHFESLVCATPITQGKPHPALYLDALTIFEVSASRALAVEDSENGILAARAAGIAVVQVECAIGYEAVRQAALG